MPTSPRGVGEVKLLRSRAEHAAQVLSAPLAVLVAATALPRVLGCAVGLDVKAAEGRAALGPVVAEQQQRPPVRRLNLIARVAVER